MTVTPTITPEVTTNLPRTSEDTLPVAITDLTEKEKSDLLSAHTLSSTSLGTSGGTSASTLAGADHGFTGTKSFHIEARGIGVLRLPLPSRELEIPVYGADGGVAYVSTRERMSSGNAVLSSPSRGDLVHTTYFFGPGRDPVIKVLGCADGDGEIKAKSRWTSRTQEFDAGFRWAYRREKYTDGKGKANKRTVLAMEVGGEEKSGKGARQVAKLMRDKETRTPNSRHCSAGNGGELMLDQAAMAECGVGEEVVVASCLMMLKKEIDRRRIVNMIIISGAASGGS